MPGFSVRVSVDTPPGWTVLPSWSTPLPSTAMPCGTPLLDGLTIFTVTVPAFAVSFVVSKLSPPFGSAVSVTVDAAPPEPVVAAGVVLAVVVPAGAAAELLLELPQAVRPTAARPRQDDGGESWACERAWDPPRSGCRRGGRRRCGDPSRGPAGPQTSAPAGNTNRSGVVSTSFTP